MNFFIDNIEDRTENNQFFRSVLYTGKHMQLVVMSLKPGEDIGEEVHDNVDQFFRFEDGEGKLVIDGHEYMVEEDMVVIVPAGSKHNIINTSTHEDLKIYTIYTPPNHPDKTVHSTREEAMKAEENHH
jgi:mannose-6-phosphate isomerase-like protein (cupin superfamily)